MKLGLLFSGGKDSTYAAYLAKKKKHKINCLISIHSENKDSYMFHTPSIKQTKVQSNVMDIPLIIIKTKGIKEILGMVGDKMKKNDDALDRESEKE